MLRVQPLITIGNGSSRPTRHVSLQILETAQSQSQVLQPSTTTLQALHTTLECGPMIYLLFSGMLRNRALDLIKHLTLIFYGVRLGRGLRLMARSTLTIPALTGYSSLF